MNLFLNGVVRAVAETFDLPGPILEVGSLQVPGEHGALADVRSYFPDKEYVGLDMQPGPGVDRVANVEALPWPDGSVGTVLALSCFEHVAHFWRGFAELRRVLRPDGAVLVACPFYFHIHAYPSDYWRFTPEALKLLLSEYPSKLVGWHGPRTRPANCWALAFREDRQPITPDEYSRYSRLLGAYARQPLPWARKFRYHVGRLLCGRRPFAPYLDRDRWQGELLGAA